MKNLLFILLCISALVLNAQEKPSFVALKSGVSIPMGTYAGYELEKSSFATTGFSLAVEGAWYFRSFLGIGGHIGINSHPIDVGQLGAAKVAADPFLFDVYIRSEAFQTATATIGPYASWPVWKSLALQAKICGGMIWAQTPHQLYTYPEFFMGVGPDYWEVTSSRDYGFVILSGLGLTYPISPCIGFQLDAEFVYKEMAFGFRSAGKDRVEYRPVSYLNTNLGVVIKL